MNLICKEDVIMNTGETAFTKGKEYKGYKSTYKDGYNVFPVIKAKNDMGKSHIIRDSTSSELDVFFETHFTKQ
ncbi:hypothetical protein POF51_26040 [Brevibacillus sp. AG]|uniref:hypothetical protein n=1 Tax=Brevibacillus sp. AG TaxID=3020891 RepID=UPI00232E0AAD|nr:hypothetical protein [Brevibacillus sp. AG]MDC0764185.1 hypothetical protein [Brevibacillus sp. AG]